MLGFLSEFKGVLFKMCQCMPETFSVCSSQVDFLGSPSNMLQEALNDNSVEESKLLLSVDGRLSAFLYKFFYFR